MKREYPEAPIVSVALIVRRDSRALIVQRGTQPNKGRWTIPGGAVDVGEHLRDTGRREVREECGIDVTVGDLAGVFEAIVPDGAGRVHYHYVIIDYLAEYVSGDLTPASDIVDARWVTLEQLGEYDITERARHVLEDVLRN